MKYFSTTCRTTRIIQRGFSLIELMIVLIIVIVMSFAVFVVLSSYESHKRTMTTTNDIDQAGNYAIYQLDKTIRQAGSGYSSGYQTTYGCELFASLINSNSAPGQILPFPSSTQMADPFGTLNTSLGGVFRLAPIVIAYQATIGMTDPSATAEPSDALIVMSGTAGYGEYPTPFTGVTATSLTLSTLDVGFNPYDLVLIVNASPTPCVIEQVDPTFVQTPTPSLSNLPLANATGGVGYYANPIGTQDITKTLTSIYSNVFNIGNANPSNNNLPSFQIIGVNSLNALSSYDLLQGGTSGRKYNTTLPIADSVFEMHALYYIVPSTGAPFWTKPIPPYDAVTLESGSASANATLATIKAIRLGLIMRTNVAEQTPKPGQQPATSGPLTLFSDLSPSSLTYPRTLASGEQNYRYRTIEATIPLRNALILPTP